MLLWWSELQLTKLQLAKLRTMTTPGRPSLAPGPGALSRRLRQDRELRTVVALTRLCGLRRPALSGPYRGVLQWPAAPGQPPFGWVLWLVARVARTALEAQQGGAQQLSGALRCWQCGGAELC